MSSTNSKHPESFPLQSTTSTAPQPEPMDTDRDIDNIVSRLVEARLKESQLQLDAQSEAWKREEAIFLGREDVIRRAMEDLNTQLAAARSEVQKMQAYPMLLDADSSVATTDGESFTDPTLKSAPKPKRRRSNAPVKSNDAPASNAWLRQRTDSIPAVMPPIAPTIPIPSAIEVPALPSFQFGSAAIQPPKNQTRKIPKARKKVVFKNIAEVYRFLPREMPDDLGGLQKAMTLHLRILWALLDAKEVPGNPPPDLLRTFGLNFRTESELLFGQQSGAELIDRNLVQIGTTMSEVKVSRIANQARLVEEHMLTYIQAGLSRFGLNQWCPDLRQLAYSLYNSACRIVALDTFKQALISHAYMHLNPNTSYAKNMALLIRLYDHFVFHFMHRRHQREVRSPGTMLKELKATPQYQGRIRLADARLKFLVENNYPQRYRDLIDNKATSDDEYDSVQKGWVVKRRPERSQKMDQFFRALDRSREQLVRQDKSRRWRERIRIVPPLADREDSRFHVLANGMPIDYFDPVYFNKLQPKTRNRIAVAKVSLLPEMDQSFSWSTEERMKDKVFTKKYGPPVFALYNMVSDADMAAVDGDDEWDVQDDDDNCDEDMLSDALTEREADNICESRETLSAHFSSSSLTSQVQEA